MAELPFEPRRIAVIQTAFLGDVVFTSPLVRLLKAAWPKASLVFVSTPRAAPLAACIPGVDEVVPFDKRGGERSLRGLRRVARKLNKPDLVVSPHPSLRSALLARFSGAKVRVGPEGLATRLLYTLPVRMHDREPFVQRFLDLARALGVDGPAELKLVPPAAEVERAQKILGEGQTLGLAVGSEWGTKRWPAECYAALADLAAEAGLRPVLLGSPSERPLADAVLAALKTAKPLDLVGNKVIESVAAISLMTALVGGDSGLVHIARAVGTPTLVLFGPTDPGMHNLEPHSQALRLGLDCQPCHAHGPKVCPLGHHDCMRKLSVDRVWAALTKLRLRMEAG